MNEQSDIGITKCRSCGALIWWGVTLAGKRCRFNVEISGIDRETLKPVYEQTTVSHFSSCPDARSWTKGKKR